MLGALAMIFRINYVFRKLRIPKKILINHNDLNSANADSVPITYEPDRVAVLHAFSLNFQKLFLCTRVLFQNSEAFRLEYL